jgi:hypothetical protein
VWPDAPEDQMMEVQRSRYVALGQGQEVHHWMISVGATQTCRATPHPRSRCSPLLPCRKAGMSQVMAVHDALTISCPAPISRNDPREELASIGGPGMPNLGRRGGPCPTNKKGAISRLRRVDPIYGPILPKACPPDQV